MNCVQTDLNGSWLSGLYQVGEITVLIDSPHSYVCVEINSDECYTFQGSEGDEQIEEMLKLWLNSNLDQQQVVERYVSLYF